MGIGGIGAEFGFMIVIGVIFITVFWMVCAWRAMRAHEKLAESVQELSNNVLGLNTNLSEQASPRNSSDS